MVTRSVGQPNRFESLSRSPPLLARADHFRRIEHRQLDVLERRSAREKVKTLKDEPDFLIPYFRQRVAAQLRHIHPIEKITPFARPIEASHNIHQSRFAR